MIKWTTPTLKCTIPTSIKVDYVILTIKQQDIVVEKTIQASDIEEGVFNVSFTQDETGQFSKNLPIYAQVNIMYGESRVASNIISLQMIGNLHDEVI